MKLDKYILCFFTIFVFYKSNSQTYPVSYSSKPDESTELSLSGYQGCNCYDIRIYYADKLDEDSYCETAKKKCKTWVRTFFIQNMGTEEVRVSGGVTISNKLGNNICAGHRTARFEFHNLMVRPNETFGKASYMIHTNTKDKSYLGIPEISYCSLKCALRKELESVEGDEFRFCPECAGTECCMNVKVNYRKSQKNDRFEAYAQLDITGYARALVTKAIFTYTLRVNLNGPRSQKRTLEFSWRNKGYDDIPEYKEQYLGDVFMDIDINTGKYYNKHNAVKIELQDYECGLNKKNGLEKNNSSKNEINEKRDVSYNCVRSGSIKYSYKVGKLNGSYAAYIDISVQESMQNVKGLRVKYKIKDPSSPLSEAEEGEETIIWDRVPEKAQGQHIIYSSTSPISANNITIFTEVLCVDASVTGREDCDKAESAASAYKQGLEGSKESQIREFRNGHFCSKCNRPPQAFGGEGPFRQHVSDVEAVVVQNPQLIERLVNDVEQTYRQPIQEASDNLQKIKSACLSKDYKKLEEIKSKIPINKPELIIDHPDYQPEPGSGGNQTTNQGNQQRQQNSGKQQTNQNPQYQNQNFQYQNQQNNQMSNTNNETQKNTLENIDRADELIRAGLEAERNGNLEEAEGLFSEAKDLVPNYTPQWKNADDSYKRVLKEIGHRNLLQHREKKSEKFATKKEYLDQQAAKNKETYTQLSQTIFSSIGTNPDGEKNHYRGHSWHQQISYGMDWATIPAIESSDVYTSFYDGFSTSTNENHYNSSTTSSSIGIYAGYEFYPFFSDFLHVGGFTTGRVGLNPLNWAKGGSDASSSSSRDDTYEASTLDVQLDYGVKYGLGFAQKYIKFIGEYSFSIRSLNTTYKIESNSYDSYSGDYSSTKYIDIKTTYKIQRMGLGIRFPNYSSDWTLDLMNLYEKPDFWTFTGKGILNWQSVYRIVFWKVNKWTVKAEFSSQYPANGEMKNNIIPKDKRKKIYLYFSFGGNLDYFGKNYFNENSYDGYKKGEILGSISINNANISLRQNATVKTNGLGGMLLTRFNLDNSKRFFHRIETDIKFRYNSLSYNNTNDIYESSTQFIFQPKLCYWQSMLRYLNLGVSIQSYIYNINNMRQNDFTNIGLSQWKKLYGIGLNIGFPDSQISLAQLSFNWLPFGDGRFKTISTELQLGYRLVFIGVEYINMPTSTFIKEPNFSRKYSNLFFDLGVRFPW